MTSSTADRSDLRATVSAPARAMPAWIYNHPEMTRLELERILLPSWQMLCHVSQLQQGRRLRHARHRRGERRRPARSRRRDPGLSQRLPSSRRAAARRRRQLRGPDHVPVPRLVVPPRRRAAGCRGTGDLSGTRPVRARAAPGQGGRRVRLRLRRAGRRPAAGRQDVGRARGRARALSLRGHGAAHAHHDRDLERRLEDRDGQLPGVVPRADRASGAVPHVHAGLRRPGRAFRAWRAA